MKLPGPSRRGLVGLASLTWLCVCACSGSPSENHQGDSETPTDGHVLTDGAVTSAADGSMGVADAATDSNGGQLDASSGDAGGAPDAEVGDNDAGASESYTSGPFCTSPDAGQAPLPPVCNNGSCLSARCHDGLFDRANEADLDCGGVCAPCAVGQTCRQDKDCTTGACAVHYCEPYVTRCDTRHCAADAPATATATALIVDSMVRHPKDGMIFATMGSYQSQPGAVLAFAPGATSPSYWIALPAAAGPIAITDDGSTLYVGVLGTTPGVVKIDLASKTAGAPFALGTSGGNVVYAAGLFAVPGHPELVAIRGGEVGVSNARVGLHIYKDGAPLFDANNQKWLINDDSLYVDPRSAVFTSATRAYAWFNNDLATLDLTASGFEVVGVRGDISAVDDQLRTAGGRLFAGDAVVDPSEPRLLGKFRGTGPVATNAQGTRAYLAETDVIFPGRVTVNCHDSATYARTGAVVLDYQMLSSDDRVLALELWGDAGVALIVEGNRGPTLVLAPGALQGVAGCDPSGPAPQAPALPSGPDGQDDWTQTYCLQAVDTALAADSQVLYATIAQEDERFPNRLAAIQLDGSGLAFAPWVASEPSALAISDDESTAWLAPDEVRELVRVDLKTGTVAARYPTADAATGSALSVSDLSVLPGHPQSVVVAGSRGGSWGRLNIYDEGVARFPQMDAAGTSTSDVIHNPYVLAVGESSLLVTGGNGLARLDIESQGFAVDFTLPRPGYEPTSSPNLQYAGHKLFDGSMLVDLDQRQLLGALTRVFTQDGPTTAAPNANHAYRVRSTKPAPGGKTRIEVQCFDLHTFAPSGSFNLDVPDPRQCVGRSSYTTIGMLGNAGLYLVSDAAIVLAPEALNCVPGCAADSPVPPPTLPKPTGTSAAGGGLWYQLHAQGLERDPKSGAVYVSVGATDANRPNMVVALAGDTGLAERAVYPGADPGPLALSSDGNKLYIALERGAQIVALNLANFKVSPWLELPPEKDSFSTPSWWIDAIDMALVPGTDDSIALVGQQLNDNSSGAWMGAYLFEQGKETRLWNTLSFPPPYDAIAAVDKDTFWLLQGWPIKASRASDGTFSYTSYTSAVDPAAGGIPQRLFSIGAGHLVTDTGSAFDGQTGQKVKTLTGSAFTSSDDGKTVFALSTSVGGFTLSCYDATTLSQTGSATLTRPGGYYGNKPQQLELLGEQGLVFRADSSVLAYPTALQGVAGCGN